MKRKVLLILLAVVCIFMLASCLNENPKTDNSDHIHTEVDIPEVPATCIENGLTAGKKCSECGVITVNQEIIPLSHSFQDKKCTVCGLLDESKGLKYILNSDGESYSVSGYGECTDRHIVIPTKYNGKPVTGIADRAFYSNNNVYVLTIPEGVTDIGCEAFMTCMNLSKVNIPNSIEYIGHSAFKNNSLAPRAVKDGGVYLGTTENPYFYLLYSEFNATELIIQAETKFIDAYSVNHTIENITIAEGNQHLRLVNGCIIDTETKTLVFAQYNAEIPTDGSFTSIGDAAFLNYSIKDIIIPEGVTYIGAHAFEQASFDSIILPESLKHIGSEAFAAFSEASRKINIPNGIEYIADDAFAASAFKLNKKDNIYYLGNDINPYLVAVKAEESILSTSLHQGVKFIQRSSFEGCSEMTQLSLPEGIEFIGSYAFKHCSALKSVIIPSTVKSIGKNAFSYCYALEEIEIPAEITGIDYQTFYFCESLTSITIPNSVTVIGDFAFDNCRALTSITIPDSVTSIGQSTFSWCNSLTDIYFTGTKEEWNSIDKGRNWDEKISTYTVHCSDGDISK